MKGKIIDYTLVKTGKQVQKFWKYSGYAVSENDLEKVRGVKLYTKDDGILYARREVFYQHGATCQVLGDFGMRVRDKAPRRETSLDVLAPLLLPIGLGLAVIIFSTL
jgi:hypothetical protein